MNTNTDSQVEQLRAELEAAEGKQREEKIKDLVGRLGAVRAERMAQEKRYTELQREFHAVEQNCQNARGKLHSLEIDLSGLLNKKPAVADYLPSDPEVVEWRKLYSRLTDRRDKVETELREQTPILESLRNSGLKYEGLTGTIAQLRFAEANLTRQIEGIRGGDSTKAFVRSGGSVGGVADGGVSEPR